MDDTQSAPHEPVAATTMWTIAQDVGANKSNVAHLTRDVGELKDSMSLMKAEMQTQTRRTDLIEPALTRLTALITDHIPTFDFVTELLPMKGALDRVLEREEERQNQQDHRKDQRNNFEDSALKWMGAFAISSIGAGYAELSNLPPTWKLSAIGGEIVFVLLIVAFLAAKRYWRN